MELSDKLKPEWETLQWILKLMIAPQLLLPMIIFPISDADVFMISCIGIMILLDGFFGYRIWQNKTITKREFIVNKIILFTSPAIIFGMGMSLLLILTIIV